MDESHEIKYRINLNNISSPYIIKRIFTFLFQKQKFNMIIYNKKLQKLFSVDFEDYKKISEKYKISEKNNKGKEYLKNTNILIFEGEYLKGRRNGKGKEYYCNGKLLFEGEYLKGKIWNGNGYNINSNIEYEIKDGKGNIKEYDYNGKLLFEGEYNNGERNGKGKELYYDLTSKFEGQYLNGQKKDKRI